MEVNLELTLLGNTLESLLAGEQTGAPPSVTAEKPRMGYKRVLLH
jgi:hypothetical protein